MSVSPSHSLLLLYRGFSNRFHGSGEHPDPCTEGARLVSGWTGTSEKWLVVVAVAAGAPGALVALFAVWQRRPRGTHPCKAVSSLRDLGLVFFPFFTMVAGMGQGAAVTGPRCPQGWAAPLGWRRGELSAARRQQPEGTSVMSLFFLSILIFGVSLCKL